MRWPSLRESRLLCWVEHFCLARDAGELFEVPLLEVVEVLPRFVEVFLEHHEGSRRLLLEVRVRVEGRQRLAVALLAFERSEV